MLVVEKVKMVMMVIRIAAAAAAAAAAAVVVVVVEVEEEAIAAIRRQSTKRYVVVVVVVVIVIILVILISFILFFQVCLNLATCGPTIVGKLVERKVQKWETSHGQTLASNVKSYIHEFHNNEASIDSYKMVIAFKSIKKSQVKKKKKKKRQWRGGRRGHCNVFKSRVLDGYCYTSTTE